MELLAGTEPRQEYPAFELARAAREVVQNRGKEN